MPDLEISDRIRDDLAEVASFCLLISGPVAAGIILRDTQPNDYVSFDRAIHYVMVCAKELHDENSLLDFISIRDRVEQKGFISKVGGSKNLSEMSRRFRVVEGRISFELDSETILADVVRVAAIIKEKARKRTLYRESVAVANALLPNPELEAPPISADQACNRLREAIRQTESRTTSFAVRIREDYEKTVSRYGPLPENQFVGKRTGIDDFDRLTWGLRGNDYILIAAQDKGGKSSVALQMINGLLKDNNPCAYVSFELDRDMIYDRLVALNSNGRLPYWKIRNRMMTSEERDLAIDIFDTISRRPLFIIEGKTGDQALVEVQRLIQTEGLICGAWDYIQRGCEMEEGPITKLSIAIADLGLRNKEADYFNIVCAQLNDAGAKQQRATGYASLNYLYKSNQPKRDCSLGMVVMMDPEIFICDCEDQTRVRRYTEGGKQESNTLPKWEKRPSNNLCPECVANGAANPHVRSINVYRDAKLVVDRARSSGQGDYIPLKFHGDFYRFDTISPNQNQPRLIKRQNVPEDGALIDLLLEES